MRVWIETDGQIYPGETGTVTLRVRVWIETVSYPCSDEEGFVTLRVRVWIETRYYSSSWQRWTGHPPREGVD